MGQSCTFILLFIPLAEITLAEAETWLVRTFSWPLLVVLFIACANLAGLLLVRVIRRRRESRCGLRWEASGTVVLRQSLVEALVLSVIRRGFSDWPGVGCTSRRC